MTLGCVRGLAATAAVEAQTTTVKPMSVEAGRMSSEVKTFVTCEATGASARAAPRGSTTIGRWPRECWGWEGQRMVRRCQESRGADHSLEGQDERVEQPYGRIPLG